MVAETELTTTFTSLNDALEALGDMLDEGPDSGEAPEAFLKRLADQAQTIVRAIQPITPEDVDEEYYKDEED